MEITRQIALIMNFHKDYDRQIIEGVSRYASENGDWSVYLEDEPLYKAPAFSQWGGDGIIADLDDKQVTDSLARLSIPVVGVGGFSHVSLVRDDFPYVGTDDEAIGRLGAEHLMACGLSHFAFCGLPSTRYNSWSRYREKAFKERLGENGHPCPTFRGRQRSARNWEAAQQSLTTWLGKLDMPLGIMACDDQRARHVVEACRRLDRAIPTDVAILGVDNDRIMCELSTPPLSSVQQGTSEIGYQAASLLNRLMTAPSSQAPRWTTVPPKGIFQRRSTDILHAVKPTVAAALRFIREKASEGIQVADVAKHIGVSRSTLDRDFQEYLQHTTHAEIQKIRLDIAQRLLATEDLPQCEIAHRSGFSSDQYFSAVFHRALGQTPGEYRKQFRS